MNIYAILDRLLLWHKFAILSIVGLVVTAIPATLYLIETGQSLQAISREAEARVPMAAILKTIQTTQQHRGLSALALGGVQEAEAKREEKQREADQNYEALSAIVRNLKDRNIESAWDAAKRDWETLRGGVGSRSLSVAQSYEAHTALMAKLLAVNDLVADYYGLNLDPDVDTYQLIQSMFYQMPYLSEELGKMRAKGAGLLATRAATPEERLALSAIVARVADRLQQTVNQFNKSAAISTRIRGKLEPGMKETSMLANQIMQLATDKIVRADPLDYSGAEYVKLATQAIDAQYAVNAAATAELNAILDEKIRGLQIARGLMLASILGLMGLGAMILYFVARSISIPLNRAVAVAERVASGDLTAAWRRSTRAIASSRRPAHR